VRRRRRQRLDWERKQDMPSYCLEDMFAIDPEELPLLRTKPTWTKDVRLETESKMEHRRLQKLRKEQFMREALSYQLEEIYEVDSCPGVLTQMTGSREELEQEALPLVTQWYRAQLMHAYVVESTRNRLETSEGTTAADEVVKVAGDSVTYADSDGKMIHPLGPKMKEIDRAADIYVEDDNDSHQCRPVIILRGKLKFARGLLQRQIATDYWASGGDIRALVDSGATRNFVSKNYVDRKNIQIEDARYPLEVRMADNRVVKVDKIAVIEICLGQTYTYTTRAYVLPMGDIFDVILGTVWLHSLDNFALNMAQGSVSHSYRGKLIRHVSRMPIEAMQTEFVEVITRHEMKRDLKESPWIEPMVAYLQPTAAKNSLFDQELDQIMWRTPLASERYLTLYSHPDAERAAKGETFGVRVDLRTPEFVTVLSSDERDEFYPLGNVDAPSWTPPQIRELTPGEPMYDTMVELVESASDSSKKVDVKKYGLDAVVQASKDKKERLEEIGRLMTESYGKGVTMGINFWKQEFRELLAEPLREEYDESVLREELDTLRPPNPNLPAATIRLREDWSGIAPYRRPMKMSAQELEVLKQQLQELLDKGIIRPSASPFGAPVMIIPKPHQPGKFRMIVDYRALNELTVADKYPLPDVPSIMERLEGKKIFSVVDLLSGFYHIPVYAPHVERTAMSTQLGHYEWLVMSMGLKNSPSQFQRTVDAIFKGLDFAHVFIDDVIIASDSVEEHRLHLDAVFQRMRENGLMVKSSKVQLYSTRCNFLGHVISADGVAPQEDKVQAVRDWKVPQDVTQLRGFLGLVGYYRKFIFNFADKAKHLNDLTKKDAKFPKSEAEWGADQLTSFHVLKRALSEAPLLALPDIWKARSGVSPFMLQTDASEFAMGAVLMQDFGQGWRPIQYASKTFNSAECNYSTTERELLALVWATTEVFRKYIYGTDYLLHGDHRPLETLLTPGRAISRRQARWIEVLQGENVPRMTWVPGTSLPVPDALSRYGFDVKIPSPESGLTGSLRGLSEGGEKEAGSKRLEIEDLKCSAPPIDILIPDIVGHSPLAITLPEKMNATVSCLLRGEDTSQTAKPLVSCFTSRHTCPTPGPELAHETVTRDEPLTPQLVDDADNEAPVSSLLRGEDTSQQCPAPSEFVTPACDLLRGEDASVRRPQAKRVRFSDEVDVRTFAQPDTIVRPMDFWKYTDMEKSALANVIHVQHGVAFMDLNRNAEAAAMQTLTDLSLGRVAPAHCHTATCTPPTVPTWAIDHAKTMQDQTEFDQLEDALRGHAFHEKKGRKAEIESKPYWAQTLNPQLRKEEKAKWSQLGGTFTLDASTFRDSSGRKTKRCNEMATRWEGQSVYCQPDFTNPVRTISSILKHYEECRERDTSTRVTFVLPYFAGTEWEEQLSNMSGLELIHTYEAGGDCFMDFEGNKAKNMWPMQLWRSCTREEEPSLVAAAGEDALPRRSLRPTERPVLYSPRHTPPKKRSVPRLKILVQPKKPKPDTSPLSTDTTTVTETDASPEMMGAFLDTVRAAYREDKLCMQRMKACELKPTRPVDGHMVVGDVLWRVTDGHYQLVVPLDRKLRELILRECHDNPASGHLGQAKTFERVYRRFYWDGMRAEVKNYVTGCNRCQLTKVGGQKPKGFLHPIEPPTRCWSSISMDFVTGLALTARGYDAIVTFTDKFSKMVHLIPLKFNQSGSTQVARIFIDQIWRLHGAPLEILSDRDTRFTSSFWQEVHRLIGVKIKMTTAYRPQGDGQSENTNRTMEQILRAYTNNRQTDWDQHLAAAEFAVNDAVHQGTNHSPFSLVYGAHGQPMSQLDLYLESAKSKITGNPAAGNFVEKWRSDLIDARYHIVQAQFNQAKYYNKLHTMVEHAVGDRVLVSSKSITAPTDRDTKWKLRDQWYGPLTITERLQPSGEGPVTSYRLKLPHQWKVHDVFR
jgi:hypothetical protein